MKKLISNYSGICTALLLTCLFLIGCGKANKVEDELQILEDAALDSRADNCPVKITGTIVNTKNLEPIAGAVVSSDNFSVRTNADGVFEATVTVKDDTGIDDVEVSVGGFLMNSFKVNYGSLVKKETCAALTSVSWDIRMSERKEGIWIGPNDGAWYKIMDTVATRVNGKIVKTTALYEADIRRGTLNDYARVSISPDNSSAAGPGIPTGTTGLFLKRFHTEMNATGNAQQAASSRSTVVFNKPIEMVVLCPIPGSQSSVVSVDDVFVTAGSLAEKPDGRTIISIDRDGVSGVSQRDVASEIIIPLLTAINADKSLDEIEKIIEDGFAAADLPSLIVNPKVESPGVTIKQAFLGNCECGAANTETFDAMATGRFELELPSSISEADEAAVTARVLALCGGSIAPDQTIALAVGLDKCGRQNVTTKEIIATTSGVINGIPFSVKTTSRFETTATGVDCPTSTPCHQGCP